MNEKITIVVYPLSIIVTVVEAGKLWYQAPGLDIYVSGRVTAARLASVHYTAVAECVARNIPARSLRDVRPRPVKKSKKVNRDQGRLF